MNLFCSQVIGVQLELILQSLQMDQREAARQCPAVQVLISSTLWYADCFRKLDRFENNKVF